MEFDRQSVARCVIPAVLPADPRCENADFALANPGLCPTNGALIIKPAVLTLCVGDSIRFQVYEYKNGVETLLDDEIRFTSSNQGVFAIGVLSGSGYSVAAGLASVIGTHDDGREVTADVEINAASTCCDSITVATAIAIDASRSMTLAFGAGYATRLNYAKAIATTYAGLLGSVIPPSDDDDDDTGGAAGVPAIYEYTGTDPNSDGIVPDDQDLPAIAYKADGTGPIYGWNTSTHVWN